MNGAYASGVILAYRQLLGTFTIAGLGRGSHDWIRNGSLPGWFEHRQAVCTAWELAGGEADQHAAVKAVVPLLRERLLLWDGL